MLEKCYKSSLIFLVLMFIQISQTLASTSDITPPPVLITSKFQDYLNKSMLNDIYPKNHDEFNKNALDSIRDNTVAYICRQSFSLGEYGSYPRDSKGKLHNCGEWSKAFNRVLDNDLLGSSSLILCQFKFQGVNNVRKKDVDTGKAASIPTFDAVRCTIDTEEGFRGILAVKQLIANGRSIAAQATANSLKLKIGELQQEVSNLKAELQRHQKITSSSLPIPQRPTIVQRESAPNCVRSTLIGSNFPEYTNNCSRAVDATITRRCSDGSSRTGRTISFNPNGTERIDERLYFGDFCRVIPSGYSYTDTITDQFYK